LKQLKNILSRSNIWHRWYVVVGCLALFVSLASLSSGTTFAARANPAMMTLKVTAYSDQGAMADGHLTYWGACAVYPPQFPFGTVIALYNSDGSFNRQCTAEDTGGAIGYGHIDLAMPGDEAGASNWGVRYLSAQVLRWGWGNGNVSHPVATSRSTATTQPEVSHSTVAQQSVTRRTITTPKPRPKHTLPPVGMHCRMVPFAHCFLNRSIFQ
jgi:3D (Asp-Asp-Asp) domain-containing protein